MRKNKLTLERFLGILSGNMILILLFIAFFCWRQHSCMKTHRNTAYDVTWRYCVKFSSNIQIFLKKKFIAKVELSLMTFFGNYGLEISFFQLRKGTCKEVSTNCNEKAITLVLAKKKRWNFRKRSKMNFRISKKEKNASKWKFHFCVIYGNMERMSSISTPTTVQTFVGFNAASQY